MRLLEAGQDEIQVKPPDLNAFNKAKMNIAQAAGLKMDQEVPQQLKNKGKANALLNAAEKDPNFKQIKDPGLNSVEGLQAAFTQTKKNP